MRLGLCCQFIGLPIKFRTTTASYLERLRSRGGDFHALLSILVLDNAKSLIDAVFACSKLGIGAFRINSQFFPLYTHPDFGYVLTDLPDHKVILRTLCKAKEEAKRKEIRLTFHPDQFVVLSSPHPEVIEHSLAELEYHGLMAELVGADVINIHGGGAYGEKESALARFASNFRKLSKRVQKRLTVENDDRTYTPQDLLPLCHKLKIPLVYDVHHHRCLPDGWSVEEATARALTTWNREPLFHISSPKGGWKAKKPQLHHDFINPKDFPICWKKIAPLTVEVEAKAKEKAVCKLMKQIQC